MNVELPDVEGPFHIRRNGEGLQVKIGEDFGAAPVPIPAQAGRARNFAGFRLPTLGFIAAILALLAWNSWMTREVLALRRQHIVSVSLASLITDFVHDQSRQPGSPDEAALRTRLYLVATQKALVELARNGTPVLASEAVLGNSVPDDTVQVKQAVARAMAQAGQH